MAMQELNENQIVIQNTKTGKRAIVTKHFFEAQKKKNNVHFADFEAVPDVVKASPKKKAEAE